MGVCDQSEVKYVHKRHPPKLRRLSLQDLMILGTILMIGGIILGFIIPCIFTTLMWLTGIILILYVMIKNRGRRATQCKTTQCTTVRK